MDGNNGAHILVNEGKTFKTEGSAGVYFSQEEFLALNNYKKYVQPLFLPTATQLFCHIVKS